MSSCGTYSSYVKGCRCDKCKQSNKDYQMNYRKTKENRAKAVVYAKKRNRAALLALRHLRATDMKTYYALIDEANQWVDGATPN